METKVWYKSKTLWVAVIALVASIAQSIWGIVIDPATQGIILSIIMIILRLETHGPVTATKSADPAAQTEASVEELNQ